MSRALWEPPDLYCLISFYSDLDELMKRLLSLETTKIAFLRETTKSELNDLPKIVASANCRAEKACSEVTDEASLLQPPPKRRSKGEGPPRAHRWTGERDKNTGWVGWVGPECCLRASRSLSEVGVFCLGEQSKILELRDF